MSLQLPEKIEQYVASLSQLYRIKGKNFLLQLLVNSTISIEQHSYDNWDGGQYGFLLHLQVPDIIFAKIVDAKDKYESEISGKLNKLIKIPGEFIDCVSIEMQLLENDNWREKSGFVLPAKEEQGEIMTGKIVAVGKGKNIAGIGFCPVDIKVGEKVRFQYGTSILLEGKSYSLVNEADVLMVI